MFSTGTPTRPTGLYCEDSFEGGGWALVRHVSKNTNVWHEATDNLAGTQAYGSYGTPTSAFSFSLAWSTLVEAKEFLFMTGMNNFIRMFLFRSVHHA
jgi:hypothetical protein